jgi:phytoene synthase
MDLDQSRYLDFAGLKRYCWHVASVVGILSARIFGITRSETLQYAESSENFSVFGTKQGPRRTI